jgi:uncharacterized membrane protein
VNGASTGTGSVAAAPTRRLYIDWLRGVAVLFMILWHSVDSWTRLDDRASAAFSVVVFFAGWAAPLFLFLAGVSLPLAGVARMARGADRQAASRALQRRGWQVFVIAHLFRFQSFVLNPNASWNGLLKPDILNILGLGLVLAAVGWGRATSRRALILWLGVPAAVVALVLTPLAPTWWWPTLLPDRLEGYIRIVNGNAVFALFPGVAYLLAGASAGTLAAQHAENDGRFQGQTALWGAVLFALGGGAMFVRWPPAVSFWVSAPAVVIWRVGTMALALSFAWRWLLHRRMASSNALLVFGRTSLFVYWVHVELAYGNLSYPLHHALPLRWSLPACAVLTAVMLGAAHWWLRHRPRRPLVPPHMRASWRSSTGLFGPAGSPWPRRSAPS